MIPRVAHSRPRNHTLFRLVGAHPHTRRYTYPPAVRQTRSPDPYSYGLAHEPYLRHSTGNYSGDIAPLHSSVGFNFEKCNSEIINLTIVMSEVPPRTILSYFLKGLSGEMEGGPKMGSNDAYWRTIWPLCLFFYCKETLESLTSQEYKTSKLPS